jgi:integral membrane protein
MKSPLLRFRTMAIICGINLLILIFAYLPAKYAFNLIENHRYLIVVPIAHGYFYIAYILTVLQLGVQKRMSLTTIAGLVIAGTVPFASFIAERNIVKKYS